MRNFFKKLRSDSWSKYFSKTVQRVGKNNAGFSLVELIVVIAIMAVLAAVAVIGVSIYIPKAQKAADEQMIADIKTAVDLYANLESVQPGQSGYIVIHKDKGTGKTSGNVSVGGSSDEMEAFLEEALKATFGEEKYGTELKVSYGDWKGTLSNDEIEFIAGSGYIDNTDDLLVTIESLTDALKAFYDGQKVGDSQTQANQAVLDVAANTGSYVNSEEFVKWWIGSLMEDVGSNVFSFPAGMDDNLASVKAILAARYARFKGAVLYTGCTECNRIFSNTEPFDALGDPTSNLPDPAGAAVDALNTIFTSTYEHARTCSDCTEKLLNTNSEVYYCKTETAKNDANTYLAMLGQIDNRSDELSNSDSFTQNDFYKGALVGGIVNEYVSSVNAYKNTGAKSGDIVITVSVDRNGNVIYKANISE